VPKTHWIIGTAKKLTELNEYWRGGVEQWECDSMGHMNVRFWMRRFYDSLPVFANQIGLSNSFSPSSPFTLTLGQAHLKFVKEAHVGAPLYLVGGPSSFDKIGLRYYAEIRHSVNHELAATLNANVNYINSQTNSKENMPNLVLEKLNSKKIVVPQHGMPRTIDLATELAIGDLDWAIEKGFSRIGLMVVRQDHCDCFGRFLPEMFFGAISEAVPNFRAFGHARDQNLDANSQEKQPRLGGAVLENRFDYLELPRVGDILEIRSGIVGLADKTRTLQHRIFNFTTKKPVCISHAIVVSFDLNTRKAVSIPIEMRKQIEAGMISI
jgi:acyl-CoA thioester hydrolase